MTRGMTSRSWFPSFIPLNFLVSAVKLGPEDWKSCDLMFPLTFRIGKTHLRRGTHCWLLHMLRMMKSHKDFLFSSLKNPWKAEGTQLGPQPDVTTMIFVIHCLESHLSAVLVMSRIKWGHRRTAWPFILQSTQPATVHTGKTKTVSLGTRSVHLTSSKKEATRLPSKFSVLHANWLEKRLQAFSINMSSWKVIGCALCIVTSSRHICKKCTEAGGITYEFCCLITTSSTFAHV